jgi:hypothetical protein
MLQPLRTVAALALTAALAAGLLGCSSGSKARGATGSCGAVKREAFDTNSLQHVLPNAPEPHYLTDPPTSGPHQPSPPISGLQTAPLTRPVQVGLLEGGNVLVQYKGLTADEVRALGALAGPKTVVAPNASLRDGQVVLTAWLQKQTCDRVDTKAVARFVTTYGGHGFGTGTTG